MLASGVFTPAGVNQSENCSYEITCIICRILGMIKSDIVWEARRSGEWAFSSDTCLIIHAFYFKSRRADF